MTQSTPKPVGPMWKVAFGGTAAIALAAAFGLTGSNSPTVVALRVLLTFAGALAVGIACYLRPGHAKLFGLAFGAALLTRLGFPPQWDSTVIISGMAAVAAGVGAIITAMPMHYRKVAASAIVLLHFGGIMVSVTSPSTPPWLTDAIGTWIYRPYLQSTYLTNAYHFYSPEPGPASQLWFCVKYKPDAKGNVSVQWLKFPSRPKDMFDPLALSYYRRLSLTMRIEDVQPTPVTDDMKRARIMRSVGDHGIPFSPEFTLENQYILPSDAIREFYLPSYVRHVAHMKELRHPDGLEIDTIRVYRVIHLILSPQFLQVKGPYDPTTYEPFYLGEFDTSGKLTDPGDPLLYWMIPIMWVPDPNKGDIPPWQTPRTNPENFILIDGVQLQTGSDHNLAR